MGSGRQRRRERREENTVEMEVVSRVSLYTYMYFFVCTPGN